MQVNVPSFAKLNLDLRVLYKRPDGFHELRTIFQTVTLRDTLSITFERARRTRLDLDSSIEIPDNLVLRSAKLVLDHLKVNAQIRLVLRKQIPMGAGMGGGSSNAAAVLIALPALASKQIPISELIRLAESLGSDVPFFLYGGTALGIGRGTELYPLPDEPARHALVIHTGIHVSTAEAYRSLARPTLRDQPPSVTNALTSPAQSPMLGEFQTLAWTLNTAGLDQLPLKNDFEAAVFETHSELAAVARKLRRLGAKPALMTGSGSAIFGLFQTAQDVERAAVRFTAGTAFPIRFVPRGQYARLWQRALGPAAAFSCFATSLQATSKRKVS